MNGYPLRRLLQVRRHREEEAQLEATRRRSAAEAARIAAETAEKTARDFARERPAKEAALFEAIRGKVLPRREVDAYHAARADLAARELELLELAGEARKVQAEAERALDRAMEDLRRAMREVQKFEEHQKIWTARERARLEAAEDLEAEESAQNRRSGDRGAE